MADKRVKKKVLHKKKTGTKKASGLADPRFEHVSVDPKFRSMGRKERKVAVDQRFAGMFKEPKFRLEYSVDKRGRPMRQTTDDHLRRLYELSSDEESDDESEQLPASSSKSAKKDVATSEKIKKSVADLQPASSSDDQSDDDEEIAIRLDLARGDGNISSSGDSSSEWEFEEKDEVEHEWAELDKDARRTDEATSRLAVCNMDWDRVRAEDLLVLLNSFKPEGGVVHKVAIYPSEFGKERMAQEDLTGPNIKPIAPKKKAENNKDDDESDDGEKSEDDTDTLSREQMEAMRKYQLDRLKYFYAIVDCDSVSTASKIYDECDGMEYEASAVRLDIRFVPEGMTFDEKVRDETTVDALNVDKYKPRMWETDALQKSNVKLTWDQTDPERIKTTRAAFEPGADIDQFQDLIAPASSDEEEESDNDGAEKKYQPLFEAAGLDREPNLTGKSRVHDDQGMEMEISWQPGLGKSATNNVPKKQKSTDQVTPWQQYLEKRKEKKRQHKASIKEKRRANKLSNDDDSDDQLEKKMPPVIDDGASAELDLLLADDKDDADASKKHFNLKELVKQQAQAGKTKKKRMRQAEPSKDQADDFEIDPDDARFSAVYNSHLFNIDRSDPSYKPTLGMERLVNEKVKRKKKTVDEGAPHVEEQPAASTDFETLRLAKSLKKKTAQWAGKKRTAVTSSKGNKS